MSIQTARRMQNSRRSFVREILKAASTPGVISFAGGLPNPKFIPVREISELSTQILASEGATALQYCAAEGHPPLREWVAGQYAKVGLAVSPDQILITSGSQQGFDLVGKVLLEPGDRVIVEDPTYTAAIQAFGLYEPSLRPVSLDPDGINAHQLETALSYGARILYTMPNFQNPTGISYSPERRRQVAELLRDTDTVLVEDDPYHLLGFDEQVSPPIACDLPERTILFGSFSKILAPGLRLGWICAPMELIEKLVIAKQAVDLCSENLGQWILHGLVTGEGFPRHLQAVRAAYGSHCRAMQEAVSRYLPDVKCTQPAGGMFVWLTLPRGLSAMELFHLAIENGVAFVPGQAFFALGGGGNTLRLNFTRAEPSCIDDGIRRLGMALDRLRKSV